MNREKETGFEQIKEMWMGLAMTEAAREKIQHTQIILSEIELRKQLKDTTDSRKMLEKYGVPPLQNVEEVKDILLSAGRGECLTPYHLERVGKVLTAIQRLKDYLSRGKVDENPLAFYEENLDALEPLREEIESKIRNGGVDDYASKELSKIRGQISKLEEQMKQKAEQIMRANRAYMTDNYYTLRNGRICLPVKREYKLKVSGSVVDQSSTGSTLFIEPVKVAELYEQLQLEKISEENEVYRILYTLTDMVAAIEPVLNENLALVEKMDYIFSKGKLSLDMDATEPCVNTRRKIVMKDARHPLMDKGINVPLQFSVGEEVRGIVITGPNTGGKTVAIKTVMLNCMMAQCGLHVTCKEADICMNNSYLCDIGDGQNIAENLSTFSAHIKNVLDILRVVNEDSLVIMDELGSGTDPAEGMGIAIAILEELKKSGAIFLVTTHYPEVKEYAKKTTGIVNARMTFDKKTLRPTYQMIIGEAGESCAFYIADRLGMPHEMLRVAIGAAYGKEAVETYEFQDADPVLEKEKVQRITRIKKKKTSMDLTGKFKRGDSVMVYPDKKIGIVCEPVNDKGVLRVQLPGKKIWINHKRVKLHVAAEQLYPEDYDFSIIFDTVENRKKRHDMERKYTEEIIRYDEDE